MEKVPIAKEICDMLDIGLNTKIPRKLFQAFFDIGNSSKLQRITVPTVRWL